ASLAYALSFALVTIPPKAATHAFLGTAPVFIVITSLLITPVRTMGSMVEQAVMTLFLIIVASAVGAAGHSLSILVNRSFPGTYGGAIIQLVLLFVSVTYGSTLRLRYPRLNNAILTGVLVLVLTLPKQATAVEYNTLSIVFDAFMPNLAGLLVNLFVNFVFFPSSATTMLRSSLRKTLVDIANCLEILTREFVLHTPEAPLALDEIKSTVKSVRGSLNALVSAIKEAKREFSYSEFSPNEMRIISSSLWQMLNHLAAMESCIVAERKLVSDDDFAGVGKARLGRASQSSFGKVGATTTETGHRARSASNRDTVVNVQLTTDAGPAITDPNFGGDKNVLLDFVVGPPGESMYELMCSCVVGLQRLTDLVSGEPPKEEYGVPGHFPSLARANGTFTKDLPKRRSMKFGQKRLSALGNDLFTDFLDKKIDEYDSKQSNWMKDIAIGAARTEFINPNQSTATPTATTPAEEIDITSYYNYADPTSPTSVQKHSPYREEYFLAFFFVFSLRELAQELRDVAEKIERLLARREMETVSLTRTTKLMIRKPSGSEGKVQNQLLMRHWWAPDVTLSSWLRSTDGSFGYSPKSE
ncbi:hypothetical protein HK096_007299, partial [Nowakowskiella sp. JEL0078]